MNLIEEIDFTIINLNDYLEKAPLFNQVNEALKESIILLKKLKIYIEND